jgi:hypothetical protein
MESPEKTTSEDTLSYPESGFFIQSFKICSSFADSETPVSVEVLKKNISPEPLQYNANP